MIVYSEYFVYGLLLCRGVKSQELDTPAIEKRFAYTFLQQLITYVDQAHQHMMEFGESAPCSSPSAPHICR